eukprot:352476-Chlamydomonas_euryale.AAC.19
MPPPPHIYTTSPSGHATPYTGMPYLKDLPLSGGGVAIAGPHQRPCLRVGSRHRLSTDSQRAQGRHDASPRAAGVVRPIHTHSGNDQH